MNIDDSLAFNVFTDLTTTSSGQAFEYAAYNSCSFLDIDQKPQPNEIQDVKWVAYGILVPILVTLGILGDILNLIVLTRPNMTGVAYIYMRGYVAASLFGLLCAIPFTYRILTHEFGSWHSYPLAIFHTHIELFLGNSCVAIGVLMLLALTVERFIAVCYPAQARRICGTSRAYITVAVIPITMLVLYSPNLFISKLHACLDLKQSLVYRKQLNTALTNTAWFRSYRIMMEVVLKLIPALILVYLNVRIIYTYRAVCEKRRNMTTKASGEQRRQYAEESRLMFLLGGTSTLFFFCMTPMIVLSLTVHWVRTRSIPYQIFRATANVLEIANFAVTFYIYCMFSKDFRETFLRTLRSAKSKSVPPSFLGSVSGLKDTLRPP